ncbi:DUF2927 domain-containing protein [Gymnodinialimonas ceratoperidinii]|uniref:DUF2927 domain-containing protein n=2 Tax=Gymnodinialimonas ceratoperidinii TaxID=2856823 RepID=A0A8F6TSC6_9RHOB|nr:DUF2927 domain-containing protein [Gymnodinialimonas ceratoperidinii]QXT38097.1 DUF2927 domain-containing protein [Gymnodinialimonas ceratoperidinii]
MSRFLTLTAPVFAMLLAACAPSNSTDVPDRAAAAAPGTLPAMNTFGAPRISSPTRSNSTIAADFLDLSFQMESGRTIDRISRFEGPITVAVASGAPASLNSDLDQLLRRLRSEAGIDISRTSSSEASITIETMPRSRMQRVVPQAACFVVPRVSSWSEFRRARSGRSLDWTTLDTRERVAVFIPSDVSPQEVRDCLHEEIAQALGPLNDLYRLPDSVFNDDNFNAVLTGFDMLILRTYYDDALRSGMTRAQVASALPGILSRINPGGGVTIRESGSQTPRAWITAIEAALGPGQSDEARVSAAERAVRLAQQRQWTDTRLAFSYFALGRLTLSRDVETSIQAFQSASTIFERVAPNGIQSAHVDMQLAAFALSAGRTEEALRLTERALPAATRAQNASLLSTLLMIRAEALDDVGRASEARSVRLDSLAWGRYGFGSNAAVSARLTEVAALSPGR